MSYNQYQGYGGNPYGDSNPGGAGANPYGGENQGYGQQQQYGGQGYGQQVNNAPPQQAQQQPPYPNGALQDGHTLQPGQQPAPPRPTVMSDSDFLARVEAIKADIRTLTSQISSIGTAHQRALSSADSSSSSALESLITQTQVLNTTIKDQIRRLEEDSVRSGAANKMKSSQVNQLKGSFRKQLEDYSREESDYRQRYREQIARQYRIVNPDASESEVQEAQNADWGNEGVFQTALKTNRTATASTVLGAVRARHADIRRIETTLNDLNLLFQQLAEQVVLQEPAVDTAVRATDDVKTDLENGTGQLGTAVDSAKRARKLKWWCFWIVVLIVLVLALILGLYFGLTNRAAGAATGGRR